MAATSSVCIIALRIAGVCTHMPARDLRRSYRKRCGREPTHQGVCGYAAMSAAFARTAEEQADPFQDPRSDDLQDVPLANSIAPSQNDPTSSLASPRAPDDATPQAGTSVPEHFPPPHKQTVLTATVHSPESVSDSTLGVLSTSHTVFTVETKSTLQSFPKAHCSVKRRFSEFTALHDALRHKYAGYFVPPCPSKDLLQGKLVAGKAFLTKRAQDLEIFVTRCCDHPELQASNVRPITA